MAIIITITVIMIYWYCVCIFYSLCFSIDDSALNVVSQVSQIK